VRRRVTAVPAFYESLLLLDTSEATVRAGTLLLRRAVEHSASSELLPEMEGIRVVKTHSYTGFPSLRLFYWVDERDLLLLEIEQYDETQG
jgi:hypothetical protein